MHFWAFWASRACFAASRCSFRALTSAAFWAFFLAASSRRIEVCRARSARSLSFWIRLASELALLLSIRALSAFSLASNSSAYALARWT